MKSYIKVILAVILLVWNMAATLVCIENHNYINHLEQVQNAYADYLHDLWIYHPNVIEECSMDGDTFQRLSEVAEFDAPDTPFRFSSPTDSITYHQNWEAGY